MALADSLHDEVDAVENMTADGRDLVRAMREKDLPEILALVSQNEPQGSEPFRGVQLALEVFAARLAERMNALTTAAARDGVERGKKRGTETKANG